MDVITYKHITETFIDNIESFIQTEMDAHLININLVNKSIAIDRKDLFGGYALG